MKFLTESISISKLLWPVTLLALLYFLGACSGQSATATEAVSPTALITQKPAILVTGITGRQGGALARHLLERGFQVRGLSRSLQKMKDIEAAEPKIEMMQGDFNDPESLRRAMAGMYGVFLNTPVAPETIVMGQNAIDAAKASGVQYIVYSTYLFSDPELGRPDMVKAVVEKYLRDSGLGYTVLRPVTFMENMNGKQDVMATVGIRDPRNPTIKRQYISVNDIGLIAAEVFENPDEWDGRDQNIAGDELTNPELVDMFSRLMGIQIKFEQTTWEEWAKERPSGFVKQLDWHKRRSNFLVDLATLRKQFPNMIAYEEYLIKTGWENWNKTTEK